MVKTIKLNLLFELLFIFLAALILTVTVLLFFSSLKVVSSVGQESNPLGNLGIGETAPSDTTPPSVSVTNPANGSTVPKNSIVTIQASASDVSGINKVEFYVNGILKCTDTTSAYSCNWKVPKRPNITYTLLAKTFDVAGNTSTSTVTVTS